MLWIRSQDKTKLVKINSLEYEEYQGNHIINGYYTNEVDNYDLGVYSSKKRALEVLDEIQNYIIYQEQTRLDTDNNDIIKGFKSYSNIYEMPQD